MTRLLTDLDAILRAPRSPLARAALTPVPIARLLVYSAALAAIYGVFVGLYSVTMRGAGGLPQMASAGIKVPLLFLLTLGITFPSMYVLSALAGSRLDPGRTFSLLLHSLAIALAMAASFAPILGFFTLSTTSYHFMVLLNVGFLGSAGLVGSVCLSKSLSRVLAAETDGDARAEPAPPPVLNDPQTLHAPPPQFRRRAAPDPAAWIFQLWIILYGIVGAQMAWVLRPFVGSPDQPFALFRERTGNVLQAVGGVLLRLMGIEAGDGR